MFNRSLLRLTSLQDAAGTAQLGYSLLNLTGVTNRLGFTNGFCFDPLGRVRQSVDASGIALDFGYTDAAGLSSVTNALAERTAFAYDFAEQMAQITYGDGPSALAEVTGFDLGLPVIPTIALSCPSAPSAKDVVPRIGCFHRG